ncbi:MAG: ATP-binding protein [Myxococcota bacterium]
MSASTARHDVPDPREVPSLADLARLAAHVAGAPVSLCVLPDGDVGAEGGGTLVEAAAVPLEGGGRVVPRLGVPVALDDERISLLGVVARQAAERLEAERLLDAVHEGVVLRDASGAVLSCNRAALRILGLTARQVSGEAPLDPDWQVIDVEGAPLAPTDTLTALREREPLSGVVVGIRRSGGDVRWVEVHAGPRGGAWLTTLQDVTAVRAAAQARDRLARQERLVTIGTIAAGVGHEINNPLAYVAANLAYARQELSRAPAGWSLAEALSDAWDGIERIRRIVRVLRGFSRDDVAIVPTDVTEPVEVSVRMAMHELAGRATVDVALGDPPLVLADSTRLSQVLVNLLVNAGQAFRVADRHRNRVTVRAEVDSGRLRIRVSDNGPGIPPQTLGRIFDPFFTTKPADQGTGLGLTIASSMVAALDGQLTCCSEVGSGTTFVVSLPLAG